VTEEQPSRDQLLEELERLRRRVAELEAHDLDPESALRALREGSPLREALLRSALDAIVTIDTDGRVLEFNPAAERMFGYRREDLLGQPMAERIVPPGMRDAHHAGMSHYLATGEGPVLNQRLELTAMRSNGEEFPVELAITPDSVAGLPVFTAYLRDLTETHAAAEALRRTELQLRESQKLEAVGKLAGGVAHDFNNLLTVILGSAEVLQFAPDDPEQVRELAGEIQRASERAAELTSQMMAFGKRQVLEVRPVDLRQVLAEGQAVLSRVLPETIQVEADPGDEPMVVLAEPGRLSQILVDLAINAREAMPEGGRLSFRLYPSESPDPPGEPPQQLPKGRLAVLEVTDTGVGMSAEVAERAFEPFFTTKAVGEGSGLGLSTVYGIVQQLGGVVDLESASGVGTTVRVRLPLHAEEESEPAVAPRPDSDGHATILLAEDEETVRRLVIRVLENGGYRVLAAEDGVVALELAKKHAGAIDLLLSDMVMPNLSGRDLAEQLRLERPDMGVILMSGYTEDGRDRDLASGGRVGFIGKPFRPAELLAEVRAALGQKA